MADRPMREEEQESPQRTVSVGRRLAVSVVVCFVLVAVLAGFGFNPTGAFRIGDRLPLSPLLDPANTVRSAGEDGYDGQFSLAIALDPLLHHPGTTASLDAPRYRYRRILFPALGWALGLGSPGLIPWALLAILVGSFLGLALTLGALVGAHGGRFPGELLPLLLVGAWISLLLGTPALLSAFLFAQALLAYRREDGRWMWIALALAGLTRETSLVLIPAFAWVAVRRWGRREAVHTTLAAAPALAWNAFVLLRLPADGALGIAGNLVIPPTGLLHKLAAVAHNPISARSGFDLLLFLSLLLALTAAGRGAWAQRGRTPEIAAAAVALSALALFAGPKILAYYVGYCRVFLELFLATGMLALTRRARLAQAALALQALGALGYLAHTVAGLG